MGLSAYLSDDTTAATSIAFTGVAGSSSTAPVVHLWLDKGTAGGSAYDIKAWPEIQVAGVWVSSGHEALDQGWFQMRLSGGTGPAAESRFVVMTANTYRVVKTSRPFTVGDLYGNCSRYISVRITVPLDAAATSFNWRIRVTSNVVSVVTDPNLPCGVLRGLNDWSMWEWVLAPQITATGTPDDEVHGSFHSANWFGVFRQRCVADDITLNQNDVAAAALTTGQAYKALIYRDNAFSTSLLTLKGTKATAASAVIPTLPAGCLPVAVVHVAYGAGGSVITSGNITQLAVDGWGRATAGSGLNVTIGAIGVQLPGTAVRITHTTTVALTASSTNRVWINSDGSFSVVTTSDDPPYTGLSGGNAATMSEWIATVTTDGSGVTAITDKRRFEDSQGRWVELQVAAGNEATGTSVARKTIPYRHQIVDVKSAVRAASSGATGSTTCDINRAQAGTTATIFTNQGGATETRPAIAAQAYTATGTPEVTADGLPGDTYVLDVDAITASGTRAIDVSASMLVYPRP